MKKFFRLICIICCMAMLIISVAGCSEKNDSESQEQNQNNGNNNGEEQEKFLSQEEAVNKLTNYSFKYEMSFNDGTKNTVTKYIDMRSEKAWLYSMDDFIYIANEETSSLYMLDVEEKTATLTTLDKDDFNDHSWGSYFFGYHDYVESFTKKGTATVAGRQCQIYEYHLFSIKYTYYIDKEYGISLKYDLFAEPNHSSFNFTEFVIGDVTTDQIMAYLEGYTIDDYRNII